MLLAMLAALDLVLWQGPHSLLGRTLFIAHLGLFMLWQPLVQTERRLSPTSLMAVVAVALLAGAYLKGWMIVLWIMMLAISRPYCVKLTGPVPVIPKILAVVVATGSSFENWTPVTTSAAAPIAPK